MDEQKITLEEADRLIEESKDRYKKDYLLEGERFKLILQHYTQEKLSEKLGISRSYIRQRVEIIDSLIPEIKGLLKENKIKFTQALTISRSPDVETQRSTLNHILADLKEGHPEEEKEDE